MSADDTLTLARSLRQAAELVIDLGWDDGPTWTGLNRVCLHAQDRPDTADRLLGMGAKLTVSHTLSSGVRCDDYAMPAGLVVSVFTEAAEG